MNDKTEMIKEVTDWIDIERLPHFFCLKRAFFLMGKYRSGFSYKILTGIQVVSRRAKPYPNIKEVFKFIEPVFVVSRANQLLKRNDVRELEMSEGFKKSPSSKKEGLFIESTHEQSFFSIGKLVVQMNP